MRRPCARAGALVLALASLPMLSAAQAPAEPAFDRSVLRPLVASVLMVEAVSTAGRLQLGSGVVVGPRAVATNCHVTRDAVRVFVVQGGLRNRASAQRADVGHDVCVLRVDALDDAPVVKLGHSTDLVPGQQLGAMGYTGGVGMQVTQGQVVALHPYGGGAIVQADTGFTSGASGGGLFTADGSLVGLLTFRLPGIRSHYFAVPVEWLPAFDATDAAFTPIGPLAGRTFWEEEGQNQLEFLRAARVPPPPRN